MINYKKLVHLYFTIILTSSLLISIGFYTYDPLQIFHKPWGRDVTFYNNMRQQVQGIVKHYSFDSIILGSSILENTSSKETNQKLGGNFINISLSGSSYYERLFIMNYVFKKKPIKKVIYSLDAGSYIHQQKGYPNYPLSLFDYLYDDTSINDIKAYLTYDFLECLLTFSTKESCIGKQVSLDRPNAWFNDESNKIRYGGLNKWFEANNSEKIKTVFKNILFKTQQIQVGKTITPTNINEKITNAKEYVDTTILNFIKEHPTTNFILVFPPYSRMQYALWAQYNLPYFEIHKSILKYITEESKKQTNLKVYAFGDQDFLDDLSNYKDTRHYHVSINSWMITQIKNNIGLLTTKNINHYVKIITHKALTYDIINIGRKINLYLNTNSNKHIEDKR